jgi:hypothetical protein
MTGGSQELFERYLAARTPEEDPESVLETLLSVHARPVLNRVVRNRLGALYTAPNAAELTAEAMLELLSRLRALREPEAEPIQFPFDALAAGVAANTVHRFFARRFPERSRLRKRLRYLVETDSQFRLWQTADGPICGLASSKEGEGVASAADLQNCLQTLRGRSFPATPLAPLVLEILRALGRPVELTRLAGIAAELIGIEEPAWISSDEANSGGRMESEDPAPSVQARLEARERTERTWAEVLQLSVPQRTALLLSARAPCGAAAWLLVDLGVVAFHDLARALEMSAEDLAAVWNRLPLEDREIAARLKLERQQVINLRATARARLARREQRASGANKTVPALMKRVET